MYRNFAEFFFAHKVRLATWPCKFAARFSSQEKKTRWHSWCQKYANLKRSLSCLAILKWLVEAWELSGFLVTWGPLSWHFLRWPDSKWTPRKTTQNLHENDLNNNSCFFNGPPYFSFSLYSMHVFPPLLTLCIQHVFVYLHCRWKREKNARFSQLNLER